MDKENLLNLDTSKGDFSYKEDYTYDAGYGLNEKVIDYISDSKNEPDWIRQFRKKALKIFEQKQQPYHWAHPKLKNVDFDKIRYYLAKGAKKTRTWDEVPDDVKETFERLGVPEQERAFLAGVEAQYDSETAYSSMKEGLEKQGVIFLSANEALEKHPDIFRPYFGKVIPISDNKYSALNSAVFSGGSFIYIPKNVKLKQPLQAYFRINAQQFGQFERTLIIADEGSEVMYMEGCTAPTYDTDNLHSAVVELVALKGASIQYVTVQNWSNNVYNLVTKRGLAYEGASISWIDCNIGSGLTMKYPAVVLKGDSAIGEVVSIAIANSGQVQDTGAKIIHASDNTNSIITSKSVSIKEGVASYRGLVSMFGKNCKNSTNCDALLINADSRTDTYPAIIVKGNGNTVEHEASVSRLSGEQIFYMRQRGLSEKDATGLAVNGFINDLVSRFPMEYSVELKRLIEMEMEGAVG